MKIPDYHHTCKMTLERVTAAHAANDKAEDDVERCQAALILAMQTRARTVREVQLAEAALLDQLATAPLKDGPK